MVGSLVIEDTVKDILKQDIEVERDIRILAEELVGDVGPTTLKDVVMELRAL